jgi:two-component system KDP operon response regulator KdpE
VLVVDDEPAIVRALVINLEVRGYVVVTAGDARGALAAAGRRPPDIVLLDLGLPDRDGLDVITGLRGWTTVPIIVLSGRTDSAQKIAALDAGADDYVTKPFRIDELLARMRAVTRRTNQVAADQPVFVIGDCSVDLTAHRVTRRAGEETRDVHLTRTEWLILEVLLRAAGRLVTKRQLLAAVWGPVERPESGYLRFYISQLRAKLERDPSRPRHLITESGMGYRFEP